MLCSDIILLLLFLVDVGTDKYNTNSTQCLKDFILECSKFVDPDHLLWFSIQSNAISDFVEASYNFQSDLNDIKVSLKEHGFHLPLLSSNMRNSRQISQMNMIRGGNIKQIKQVQSSPSTVNGRLPTLIPIHRSCPYTYSKDSKTQYFEEFDAIKYAIESLDSEIDNWVILYDRNFDHALIKRDIDTLSDWKIITYTSEDDTDSIDELKNFIECGRKTILLVERDLFLGCESQNVICLTYDRFGSGEHLRGTLLRAVENLFVIYAFDEGFVYADVLGFKVDGTYLKCQKSPTVAEFWFCNTCEQHYLCTPCKLICHQGHSLRRANIFTSNKWTAAMGTNDIKMNYPHDNVCNCNRLRLCKLAMK